MFEAGALSKALATASVCPYLLDVDFLEITGPLSQFQSKKAEAGATRELISAINGKSPTPLQQPRLDELFEALWPKLSAKFSGIPPAAAPTRRARSQADVLEELVSVVRALEHRVALLDARGATGGRLIKRYPVNLTVDEPVGKLKPGEPHRILFSSTTGLVRIAASAVGLGAEKFGIDWFLVDPRSGEVFSLTEELEILLTNPPRTLKVIVPPH